MLDGRVLGASQVEYKPFGKPPLQREVPWRLPRLASLPRLPGIGALPSPRQGRDSSYRGRDSDFALRRGRFSDFALASDFARKILRKRGSASLPELGFIPKTPSPGQRRRSVSDAARTASLTECFFTTHTPCRQSWRGHRIATLNPGVGTGLPHSILVWAQDCHTQSWRGHAPVFPRKRWKRSAVQHYAPRLAARVARKTPAVRRYTPMHSRTRRPDCPENYGSALLYSRTLTENSASVLLCSSALTDSPPGSLRRIRKVKAKE